MGQLTEPDLDLKGLVQTIRPRGILVIHQIKLSKIKMNFNSQTKGTKIS